MFLIVVPATIGVLVSLLALRYKNNPEIRINEIEIFIGIIIFITNEIESFLWVRFLLFHKKYQGQSNKTNY